MVAVVNSESAPPSGVVICFVLSERKGEWAITDKSLNRPFSGALGVERPRALGRAEHGGERRGDRRECGGEKYARCARHRFAKMFTCALNMPVSTHTCATFSAHTSVCDALDDAANGASAALAARQAAPCEPCVRNDTAGANAPTGGGQPRHKQ